MLLKNPEVSYRAKLANAPPAPMMQARASERVRSRATAFLPTRMSYRSGRKDATTANCAPSGAKAEAILASLLRKSSSFMAVSLSGLSIDPQERVLLGPEGKRDELVGDSREARKRQCAVDELLDDHRRKERRAAES